MTRARPRRGRFVSPDTSLPSTLMVTIEPFSVLVMRSMSLLLKLDVHATVRKREPDALSCRGQCHLDAALVFERGHPASHGGPGPARTVAPAEVFHHAEVLHHAPRDVTFETPTSMTLSPLDPERGYFCPILQDTARPRLTPAPMAMDVLWSRDPRARIVLGRGCGRCREEGRQAEPEYREERPPSCAWFHDLREVVGETPRCRPVTRPSSYAPLAQESCRLVCSRRNVVRNWKIQLRGDRRQVCVEVNMLTSTVKMLTSR